MDHSPEDMFAIFTKKHEKCIKDKDYVIQVQTFSHDTVKPKCYCFGVECENSGLNE